MPTYFADDRGRYVPERAASHAQLTVVSDVLDAEAITRRLGISPDESWARGAVNHGRTQKHHGWSVRSRVPAASAAEDHLTDVLRRLEPAAAKIRELARDPDVESVRCWIMRRGDNWNPGLSFTRELVASLNDLGVGLEIDIYVAGSEEERRVAPTH